MHQQSIHTFLKANFLIVLLLLLIVGILGTLGLTPTVMADVSPQASTGTPTPTTTPAPDPIRILGINYWDRNLAQEIFLPGTRGQKNGYVLLDQSDLGRSDYKTKIEEILNAGLKPVFRIDAGSGHAVPVAQEEMNTWFTMFTQHISNTYQDVKNAYPTESVSYIVGNEPGLDGSISDKQYARAYAALWQYVHEPDDSGTPTRYKDVDLLVAGQAFHWEFTDRWPYTVTQYIVDDALGVVDKPSDVDGYAIHTYGYGDDIDQKPLPYPTPTAVALREICKHPGQPCKGIGDNWGGDDSFQNYKDQLAAIEEVIEDYGLKNNKPIYITEFNTFADGGDGHNADTPSVPSRSYPHTEDPSKTFNWIGEAAQDVVADGRVKGLLWFVGAPNQDDRVKNEKGEWVETENWRYFALSEDTGRLDCARADFQSIARGEPAGSCDPLASAPSLKADFLCDDHNQGKIALTFSGLGFALDKLFITASPTDPYNLSGYDPESHHTLVLSKEKMPAVGKYATIMVSNRAGLITQQQVKNEGCKSGNSAPGNNHPDDNESAASSTLPGGQFFTLPAGARAIPRVAVLNRGFAGSLWQLLNQIGEPSVLLKDNFDPAATAGQYPVLLIPSGGLYGWENSLNFKKRLELYAEAGGTIVAFAQHYGYEFGVLPGAAGGTVTEETGEISPPLSAYGWQEDNACFEASLRLNTTHPALSGFDRLNLTANVDGYFSTVPAGAAILLTRNQNGAAGVILYPYGQGRVFAASMYDDWGALNGQTSVDAQTFLRDLLSWAVEPADIPTYAPGEEVSLSAEVTNPTGHEAVAVRLSLINPAREIVETRVFTTPLAAGETASLEFTPSAPAAAPLGIWRVDATLLNGREHPLGPRLPVGRFIVTNPPALIAPDHPLSLNITAPTDEFPYGSQGELTFHVVNHSDEAREVTLHYGLPHHTWEINTDPNTGSGYGFRDGLSHSLTVSATSEATYVYRPTLYVRDTLWARLDDESGQEQAQAIYTIFPLPPAWARISNIRAVQPVVWRDSPVELQADVRNSTDVARDQLTARWWVVDAQGETLYREDVPIESIPARGAAVLTTSFTLPSTAAAGVAVVRLTVDNNATSARGTFRIWSSPVSSRFPADLSLAPGQSVPLQLTNGSPLADVTNGEAVLSLVDDTGVLASGSTEFSLAAGQTSTENVDLEIPDLEFKPQAYRLQVALSDEYGQQSWQTDYLPLTFSASTSLNRPEQHIRETTVVTVTLSNPGPFVQALDLTLAAPGLEYSETYPVRLEAGQELEQAYEITIPEVMTGLYALEVSATLPNDSRLDLGQVGAIYIPDSKLQATVSGQPTGPGETLTVNVANIGGVDTTALYDLGIYDRHGLAIAAATGEAAVPVDQPLAIPLTIPAQFKSGLYSLAGTVTNQNTGQRVPVYQALNLGGLDNQLTTFTNAESYLTTAPIETTAVITNTGAALTNGQLTLRIVNAGPVETATADWEIYTTANGLADNTVIDVTVDGQGNKWFVHGHEWSAHPDQLSRLSPGGNWETFPLNSPDAFYQTIAVTGTVVWVGTNMGAFTFDGNNQTWLEAGVEAAPLCVQGYSINDVAVDSAGRVWFATAGNGLCVLDTNGTPANLADDQWAHFTNESTANGLPNDNPVRLDFDAAGYAWVMSNENLAVFDEGTDLFNPTDGDQWVQLTPPPPYWWGQTLMVDPSGYMWLGTDSGLYRLDDGGNPFDNSADTWTSYTVGNSDLINNNIRALAADEAGNLWIGTTQGVSVLLPGGQWRNYTPLEGLGSGVINAIAVDAAGNRWLATDEDNNAWYDEGYTTSYLPGGVTAAIGPGLPQSLWKTFTSGNSNLVGDYLEAMAADVRGNIWMVDNECPGGGTSLPSKVEGLASPLKYSYCPVLQRLAPGQNWTTFDDPPFGSVEGIPDMVVDAAGQVWLAVDDNSYGYYDNEADGLYVFSPQLESWTPRRPAELKGQPTALAVAGAAVWAAFDSLTWDGNFYPEGIAVYSLVDHAWTVVYRGNEEEAADHIYFRDLAIAPTGEVWAATNRGVWRLVNGNTWLTYTTIQPGTLSNDDVRAIAIDRQGNRWFATAGGVDVLSADDSQWATFSTTANLLAVDNQGGIWFDHRSLDYGDSPFDQADDLWTEYNRLSELGDRSIIDMAVDEAGQVWFAAGGQGLTRYTPPATVGRVLWQHSTVINAGSPQTVTETVNLTAAELETTGKFYLEADLSTAAGQSLGAARYPFYVFPTQTGLTLAADRSIYSPGQSLTLSGQIRNGTALPLTGQTLTVSLNGQGVYTETNITIPAESRYPFSVTTTTPANSGPVMVGAALGDLAVRDNILVAAPALDTRLTAPELTGRAPFDLRLTLSNPGKLDLALTAVLDGQAETLTLPAGEARSLSTTRQITATTLVTAQIQGDITASLTRTVYLGEAAEMMITPEQLYPAGRVEIPYTLTNTGQLPLSFPLELKLYTGATLIQSDTLELALPVGGEHSGRFVFDLPAGNYRLDYLSPYVAGTVAWPVAARDQVTLDVQPQAPIGSAIPLTVTVINTGANPVTDTITVETDFFSGRFDPTPGEAELPPGQAVTSEISIETANAAPGSHPVTVTVVAANGAVLAAQVVTVTLSPARLTLASVPPASLPLTPGQVVTLTFGIENNGGSGADALLHFTLADFEDESQLLPLAAGESGSLDFSFYLPPELAAGDYLASYILEDAATGEVERGEVILSIAGMDLAVTGALDKPVYAPGETANLTLNIANQTQRPTPNLYALARFGNAVVTQSFSLAGNGAQTINLAVPVSATGLDDTLSYGLYDQDSTRSVYLNTTHLYRLNSGATLYPGQAVYAPGATAQVTVATTATGSLLVRAPGYSQTLTLNGSNTGFSFTLPDTLTRGTYTIDYTLAGFPPRSVAFDVTGPKVQVIEARLIDLPETGGGPLHLDLTIASETPLDTDLRAWVLYPDGTAGSPTIVTLPLSARLNNHASLSLPLSPNQAGVHQVVYQLTAPGVPDQVYAAGGEKFDFGPATVLSVETEQVDYLDSTTPVRLVATLATSITASAQLDLEMDEAVVTSQAVTLTPGSQTVTLAVPDPVSPGWHTARARLNVAGQSSVAETRFVYSAFGPDLVVRSPRLFKPAGYTATLYTYVYNLGDQLSTPSTLRLYDGNPAIDGQLIAEVAVPAMPAKKPFYNETAEFFIPWEVTGRAGLHQVYAVADAGRSVAEINEDNNIASAEVEVPPLSLAVSTDRETYSPGEPVNMTVSVANLQASGSRNITLTTAVDLLGHKPFQVVEPLTIPAGEAVERHYTWPVTATYGGTYNLIAEATGNFDPVREYARFTLPVGAEFIAAPVTGTVPLSVTFSDRSSPWGWVESWQWDFGDGHTSTESDPTHLYLSPGSYTVTLTTTVGLSTYLKINPNAITVTEVITPVAAFGADTVTGLSPMTVTFTDTSTGTVITRTWDFGDNTPTVITTAMTLSHTYNLAGVYTPTLTISGLMGSAVLTQPAYILVVAPQSSGTFALEAEDYARQLTGPDLSWQTRTVHPGYSGRGYVQVWPDVDEFFATAPVNTGPELHYGLGLTMTGTYTIWLRGYAQNSADDSVYVGLDGQPFTHTDYVSAFPPDTWAWGHTLAESGQPLTFTVETPGAHVLHLWTREDGFSLDQIILTNDEDFSPAN